MDVQILSPVAGKDYPRNWNEFLDWFPTEEACLTHLERLRWPDGFVCPRCGSVADAYRASRTRPVCRNCKHQSTVTAGSIFDKTRTPLRVWLAAVWYVTNQKQGVSALGLQRVLGLGSYQTAWMMLHRLRRAMVCQGREQLKGLVEVDEAYLSLTDRLNSSSGARCKGGVTKVLIAIAVELPDPRRRFLSITETGTDSPEISTSKTGKIYPNLSPELARFYLFKLAPIRRSSVAP